MGRFEEWGVDGFRAYPTTAKEFKEHELRRREETERKGGSHAPSDKDRSSFTLVEAAFQGLVVERGDTLPEKGYVHLPAMGVPEEKQVAREVGEG
jgi:hypothetical protein